MKNKYLILFACLLIGLVAVYIMQKRSSRITVVETGIERLLPEQNVGKVKEIRVYLDEQQPRLILKRTDKSWSLPNYFDTPANDQKIESFLKDIENLQGEKRASIKNVFSTFALDDDKALTLEFLGKDGEPLFVLLAGKQGPMGSGCFVRFKDKADVYLADKNLLAHFGIFGDERKAPEPKLWADLQVIKSPKDTWSKVELVQPGSVVTFAKEKKEAKGDGEPKSSNAGNQSTISAVWVQEQPESPKLQEGQIQVTLNALKNLQATQLIDPTQMDVYGLTEPAYQAKIVTDDGNSFKLLVNQPNEKGQVYAKLDERPQVFEIAEAGLKSIFTNLKNQLEQSEKQTDEQKKQRNN